MELKENGSSILVTDANKEEFVQLSIKYYTETLIENFLSSFLKELYSVVPAEILKIFTVPEFEMILNGIPFIDVEDWKSNTLYKGDYNKDHQVIIWFWEIITDYDQIQRGKFLQYCTGSSRISIEGFRFLESNRGTTCPFCIESCEVETANPYPKAHTCFNRLNLPIYESKEIMSNYLNAIIMSNLEGIYGME